MGGISNDTAGHEVTMGSASKNDDNEPTQPETEAPSLRLRSDDDIDEELVDQKIALLSSQKISVPFAIRNHTNRKATLFLSRWEKRWGKK